MEPRRYIKPMNSMYKKLMAAQALPYHWHSTMNRQLQAFLRTTSIKCNGCRTTDLQQRGWHGRDHAAGHVR